MRDGGRVRAIVMILVFDVGGPLATYAILRRVGLSPVSALIISGIFPALGTGLTALRFRRVDVIGVLVLAGIALGTTLGLTTHNPKLVLMEGSLPGAVFALACLLSIRSARPLIYRIAVQVTAPETSRNLQARAITAVWGLGYLAEVMIRFAVIETTSTGAALAVSKLLPYAVAAVLATWTLLFGRRASVLSANAPDADRH